MARVVEAEVAEATTAATAAATVGAAVAVTAAEERRWPSGGRAAPRRGWEPSCDLVCYIWTGVSTGFRPNKHLLYGKLVET